MSKILVAINNLTSVDQVAYANHCQFWFRLGRETDHTYGLCNPRRLSIDRMRNFAGKMAIEMGFDYLLFIDDDVLIPLDTVKMLVAADKDVIAGVTLIRGYPYHPMIFNFYGQIIDKDHRGHFIDNYKERAHPETGLLECDAVGFSCCLIKTSVLKKLRPPYFITGEHQTEDVYFCMRAKAEIPGTSIWVQTKLVTAHILGSEIIEPDNLTARLAFDEAQDPGLKARYEAAENRQPIVDPKKIGEVPYDQIIIQKVWGRNAQGA